jgi:hypothetical protein
MWLVEYIKTNPVKAILAILGIPGAVWGLIKVGGEIKTTIKDNIIEKDRKEQLDNSRWQLVDELVREKNRRTLQYDTIIRSLQDISAKTNKTEKTLNNLHDYMIDKVATKKDVLEIDSIFNEKKNEIY